jgi:hypothetical protein
MSRRKLSPEKEKEILSHYKSIDEFWKEVEFFKNQIPVKITLLYEDYLAIIENLKTPPGQNPALEKYMNL